MQLLGTICAGFPTPAEEDFHQDITLDDWIIRNREASFMLAVRGDAMRDAGIIEGDMVIVERGVEAKPGDIVVAVIDGGWTLKYFRRGAKGAAYLEAANSEFPDYHPDQELTIAAVVRAVVRRYA